ncbi:MAG: thioester reductase, partial [Duncaniella sp.]|nr:thioester reductase [Duncaniella sp.]
VMILGKRVDHDELQKIIKNCPQIDRGVVRAFLDENGLHYLTAYVIPKEGTTLKEIRKYLSDRLANFMVPEFFVKIKSIPLTRRGKVDVEALPVVMK